MTAQDAEVRLLGDGYAMPQIPVCVWSDYGNRPNCISAYGYSKPDQTGRVQALESRVTGARVIPLILVLTVTHQPAGVPLEKHSSEL